MNQISQISQTSLTNRSRTVSWDDPRVSAGRGLQMSGIDYLKALQAGELSPPPFGVLLDLTVETMEPGRAVFGVAPQEFHANPMGGVHGGVHATLIDSAAGCAIHSTLEPGEAWSTIDLHVNYVRPVAPGGAALRCEGVVVHKGRSICTAEARVTDAEGTLYAYGHITGRVVPLQAPAPSD